MSMKIRPWRHPCRYPSQAGQSGEEDDLTKIFALKNSPNYTLGQILHIDHLSGPQKGRLGRKMVMNLDHERRQLALCSQLFVKL